MLSQAESNAFTAARNAVSRKSFRRFCEVLGVSGQDADALAHADRVFKATSFLSDPYLVAVCERALAAGRGRVVDASERFPSMLWLGGARATYGGREFLGTLGDFVDVLRARAKGVAPKRTGWVIEPTTNTDGHRCNASTVAMHALFLDCDGTGYPNRLLQTLAHLGYAHVFYQSGGWSPQTPKWRVVLPLTRAFDVNGEEKQAQWKGVYNHARVVFGACASLLSVGFDPATETPCCPWFLTEKRDAADPEREVVFRAGHALDLDALCATLPPVEIEEVEGERAGAVAAEIELSDERLQKIVEALAHETSFVPSGRRDLYLALPGALLDRGVQPDDVLEICEAVSARYPRQHADKHADNVHNARTTIARWDGGTGRVTRIGTLQAVAPTVAGVIDTLLPDQVKTGLVKAMEEMFGGGPPTPPTPPTPPVPPTPAAAMAASPPPPTPMPTPPRQVPSKRKRKLCEIGRQLRPVAQRMRASKVPDRQIDGLLIECLIDGKPLDNQALTDAQVDELVTRAMRAIGNALPLATKWQQVLDFAAPTLLVMRFTQSAERVTAAEKAFLEGQAKRKVWNGKLEMKTAAWKARGLGGKV